MINKDKTRVDMSLKDYESLISEIRRYRDLFSKIASSDYVDYEIDMDIDEDDKKCCKYIFYAKDFIEDNYAYFYKDDDDLLDEIGLDDIELIIE